MEKRIPPSARLEQAIADLVEDGDWQPDRLSELGRLGAQLILQRAVEDEVSEFLGRARYERNAAPSRRGWRNGVRPRRSLIRGGRVLLRRRYGLSVGCRCWAMVPCWHLYALLISMAVELPAGWRFRLRCYRHLARGAAARIAPYEGGLFLMKFVVVQGDGMADRPLEVLGGKTPLEAAHIPNMTRMAANGILGVTPTIPNGMSPSSDVGTMSILGYDPRLYHTGRSPIEAASMGVDLGPDDIACRCNLVTIGQSDDGEVMVDFTAGHIGSEDAALLLGDLGERITGDDIEIHAGVSYRNLLVWRGGVGDMKTTPPHDITDRPIAGHLPTGSGAARLQELMDGSRAVCSEHAVNVARRSRGEREATQIWLWGQGRKPHLPTLRERFGLSGAVIAAVDLVNGLGVLAGLDRVDVPGATGYLDTDYGAKAEHALRALVDHDFVFVHVEAPDEAGHMGDAGAKVSAIEAIDSLIIGRLLAGLQAFGDWRLMVLPDHATPCALKTHTEDPVPFAVFSSADICKTRGTTRRYTEADARDQGIFIPDGHTVLERFLRW